MTQIALSVVAKDTDEAREILARHRGLMDVAELRLDLMERFDLDALLRDRPCPIIVTYRPVREGGRYEGSEERRLDVLEQAASLGAEYLDCEWDCWEHLKARKVAAKVIVSRHFFDSMPANLKDVHAELAAMRPDIVKVVGMARAVCDAAAPLAVLRRASVPTIALAMGEKGALSRLLAGKFGAYLTFGAADSGTQAAPGQLTVRRMREVYFAHLIDVDTRIHAWLTPCAPSERRVQEVNEALRNACQNAVVVPIPIADEDPTAVLHAFEGVGITDFAMHPACGESALADSMDTLAAEHFLRRRV
jgi:3-dehydroquinate dehydratase/shikimate dehydrogenase